MKWRAMSELTLQEVEKLLTEILQIKQAKNLIINEDNTLSVTIVTEWEYEDDDSSKVSYESEDEIELTPDTIKYLEFSTSAEDFHKYKQYMIAKGYSNYWKDNPYAV